MGHARLRASPSPRRPAPPPRGCARRASASPRTGSCARSRPTGAAGRRCRRPGRRRGRGQHVLLAGGQRAVALARAPRRPGRGRRRARPRRRGGWRPPVRSTGRVLEQEAGRAAAIARRRYPGRPNVVRMSERHAGSSRGERVGRREAVAARHLDVEQRDVRALAPRRVEHLVAALDLGHHLDVRLQLEQARERAAHHRLVLGDQHPDHAARPGTRSARPKPPSGRGPAITRRPPRRPLAQAAQPVPRRRRAAAPARRR